MGQFRLRLDDDDDYHSAQLQVGWKVRCVAHEDEQWVGFVGVVTYITPSPIPSLPNRASVEFDNGTKLGSGSARWQRI